jgi:hypothetical protein
MLLQCLLKSHSRGVAGQRITSLSCSMLPSTSEKILSNLKLEMSRLTVERDKQYLEHGPIPRKFKLKESHFTDAINQFLSISDNISFSDLLCHVMYVSASLKLLEHEQVPQIFQSLYFLIKCRPEFQQFLCPQPSPMQFGRKSILIFMNEMLLGLLVNLPKRYFHNSLFIIYMKRLEATQETPQELLMNRFILAQSRNQPKLKFFAEFLQDFFHIIPNEPLPNIAYEQLFVSISHLNNQKAIDGLSLKARGPFLCEWLAALENCGILVLDSSSSSISLLNACLFQLASHRMYSSLQSVFITFSDKYPNLLTPFAYRLYICACISQDSLGEAMHWTHAAFKKFTMRQSLSDDAIFIEDAGLREMFSNCFKTLLAYGYLRHALTYLTEFMPFLSQQRLRGLHANESSAVLLEKDFDFFEALERILLLFLISAPHHQAATTSKKDGCQSEMETFLARAGFDPLRDTASLIHYYRTFKRILCGVDAKKSVENIIEGLRPLSANNWIHFIHLFYGHSMEVLKAVLGGIPTDFFCAISPQRHPLQHAPLVEATPQNPTKMNCIRQMLVASPCITNYPTTHDDKIEMLRTLVKMFIRAKPHTHRPLILSFLAQQFDCQPLLALLSTYSSPPSSSSMSASLLKQGSQVCQRLTRELAPILSIFDGMKMYQSMFYLIHYGLSLKLHGLSLNLNWPSHGLPHPLLQLGPFVYYRFFEIFSLSKQYSRVLSLYTTLLSNITLESNPLLIVYQDVAILPDSSQSPSSSASAVPSLHSQQQQHRLLIFTKVMQERSIFLVFCAALSLERWSILHELILFSLHSKFSTDLLTPFFHVLHLFCLEEKLSEKSFSHRLLSFLAKLKLEALYLKGEQHEKKPKGLLDISLGSADIAQGVKDPQRSVGQSSSCMLDVLRQDRSPPRPFFTSLLQKLNLAPT